MSLRYLGKSFALATQFKDKTEASNIPSPTYLKEYLFKISPAGQLCTDDI